MGKTLTDREFKVVKKLLTASLNHKEIESITKLSGTTVSLINRFDNFNGYRNYILEKSKKAYSKRTDNKLDFKVDHETIVKEIPKSNNDTKIVMAIEALADAVARLADNIELQTPLKKEAKLFNFMK